MKNTLQGGSSDEHNELFLVIPRMLVPALHEAWTNASEILHDGEAEDSVELTKRSVSKLDSVSAIPFEVHLTVGRQQNREKRLMCFCGWFSFLKFTIRLLVRTWGRCQIFHDLGRRGEELDVRFDPAYPGRKATMGQELFGLVRMLHVSGKCGFQGVDTGSQID